MSTMVVRPVERLSMAYSAHLRAALRAGPPEPSRELTDAVD